MSRAPRAPFLLLPLLLRSHEICTFGKRSCKVPVDAKKKAPRISSGALSCRTKDALINLNKVQIARADHPLRIYKAVHVNCYPAAVHEREVCVAD
jgi:hypothetical protein